jgi:hypothetical protein
VEGRQSGAEAAQGVRDLLSNDTIASEKCYSNYSNEKLAVSTIMVLMRPTQVGPSDLLNTMHAITRYMGTIP